MDCRIDPSCEVKNFNEVDLDSGAIVTFTGNTRSQTKVGESIDYLVLERHPTLTLQSMQDISTTASNRFNVSGIRVIHRYGRIKPHETIVFVAVASAHRREAFEAADYLMDRLKTDAVFWKREEGSFGSRWIDTTERDVLDRERW
ncbi:molybdenum cofactor biosynthesis protein MoaE [Hirschia litorea]|uniref:Molybdopterin synthase catalytic subunit n=1 Tax=Hirschia litorea TaxID=1199156 RepID=A0ABW2IIC9_9PROT